MIFLHEFGHFIAAKKFGVLVHEFSIGMGPKLFSKKGKETVYSLRLLPIGGYVKLEGENSLEEEKDLNNPRSFANLHPLKRIIILFAGAFMNVLLGFLLLTIININRNTKIINNIKFPALAICRIHKSVYRSFVQIH